MKKLILLSLLIVASTAGYGRFNLRLSGGLNLTKLDDKDFILLDQKANPSHAFSLKVGKDLAKLELGVGVDVIKMTTKSSFGPAMTYASPGIPVYAFLNKKHSLPKVDLYYGLALGYMFNTAGENKPLNGKYSLPKNNGLTAGLQLGTTANIAKSIGINVEAGARYARLGYDAVVTTNLGDTEVKRKHYNIFYFPILIGIQVRL